jgi:hypothetical protein
LPIVSLDDTIELLGKHDKTIQAVFTDPAPANLSWSDIEAAMVARGAEITEGRGSRVRAELNGIRAVFHRPHPEKEACRAAVRSVRSFLESAGIKP